MLPNGKHETVDRVQLDPCITFISGILVTVSIRIVKFIFRRIYQRIVRGQLTEIDLRPLDIDLIYTRYRRDAVYE